MEAVVVSLIMDGIIPVLENAHLRGLLRRVSEYYEQTGQISNELQLEMKDELAAAIAGGE